MDVPKLSLGTRKNAIPAKLSLASTFVPKCNLRTSEKPPIFYETARFSLRLPPKEIT